MPNTTEDVTITIDGSRYRAWTDIEITHQIDAFSTFGFSAPFEPTRQEFRDTFRPFSYKVVSIRIDNKPEIIGDMVSIEPSLSDTEKSVRASGYSLPAVLGDCNMPASSYPLELDHHTLLQIADNLAGAFDLAVSFQGSPGAAFDRVAIEPTQVVLSFLADLAKQRGLVISNTKGGDILFWESVTAGTPVARFVQGVPPLMGVSVNFDPQTYFSQITGLAPTRGGRVGSKYTQQNTRLTGSNRYMTFTAEDTDVGDLPGAVSAKMGRMFGNMVSYQIEVPTWRDPSGNLWAPNTLVTLTAPGAMVYNETTLLVKKVTLKQDASKGSTTASMELVLPGSFSGEIPAVLPWE